MGSIYRPKYQYQGQERTSSLWWIQYYSHGRKIRESTETADLGEAKNILKKREAEAIDSRPTIGMERKIKFKDLAELVLNDYRKNKYASLGDLQIRLDKHVLPFFGHLKAITISPADINRYVVKRQEEGAANGSINRELTAIIRAFSLGIEYRLIPCAPKIGMLEENNVRQGFFEREQLNSTTKHLRAHNGPPSEFAYITGWRKHEILTLRWPQVDFQAGIVRLEPGTTKNKEARIFPFTSELRAILEAQKGKADLLKKEGLIIPWVFFSEIKGRQRGKRIGNFARNWDSACQKAGIPGRIFHDFRRTAVRNLVRAGIPEAIAMKMTGHKTRSIFERYNIVNEADLFEASRRLEAFSRTNTGKESGKVSQFAKNENL